MEVTAKTKKDKRANVDVDLFVIAKLLMSWLLWLQRCCSSLCHEKTWININPLTTRLEAFKSYFHINKLTERYIMTCSCMLELVSWCAVGKIFMLTHLCMFVVCNSSENSCHSVSDFLKQLDCRPVHIFWVDHENV